MRKEIVIGISTILLVATPALAAPGNGKAGEGKENNGAAVSSENRGKQDKSVEQQVSEASITPSASPTLTTTPTLTPTVPVNQQNKGKGKAKQVQGSAAIAEETCDPDATWKNHGQYVSCVAKTHPGGQVVSAAARSDVGKKHHAVTPTATPSAEPTETLTPTPPVTSPELVLGLSSNPLDTFMKAISRFFKDLPFFHKHK
jgi:hypothetical protein